MPNPASAIFRQITYKAESTYGTMPSMSSGVKGLRRVEFSPDMTKETYQSNELRTDQQIADFRHGARRAAGTLRGELSPKAYEDFFSALFRKAFAATSDLTGLSLTLAVDGAAPNYTLTRGSGDFLTSGLKIGDVIRITAGTWTDANNVNFLITDISSSTVLKVLCLNAKAVTTQGPVATSTISVPGKKVWVPSSGHLDTSFSIESYFADLTKSEVYTGMKVSQAALALPSTGMSTGDFSFVGQNVTAYAAQQSSNVTAAPAYGIAAAVNGALIVNGVRQLAIRDLSININGNIGAGSPVVGSNTVPFSFPGRIVVDGQFSGLFDAVTLRDLFYNETEVALNVCLTSDNTDTANFLSLTLPRIKLGSASKNDAADGIVQTCSFTALLKADGGAGTKYDATTIVLQDSQAT